MAREHTVDSTGKKRLLLFISEDWYFWSHRLSLARAARAAGYEVALVTRVGSRGPAIENEGIRLYPLKGFARSSANPLRELATLRQLWDVYRDFRPTVAHHVALKPVIYGSIAAWRARVPSVVNALGGMGYVFASPSLHAALLRSVISRAFRATLNRGRSCVIVQNEADCRTLVERGIVPRERIAIVRGSGVDTRLFVPPPDPGDGSGAPAAAPIVMLASRILWDKGVGEFVAAARIVRASGIAARFVLVGNPDPHNPETIARSRIEGWVAEGVVEWWGLRKDMQNVLPQATVVCLPSYHEGLPKVLLEAAACARPIVATDIAGCRGIARDGVNALLVPVRDAPALAMAISRLLGDGELRRRFGEAGRKIVVEELSDEIVGKQILGIYDALKTEGPSRLPDFPRCEPRSSGAPANPPANPEQSVWVEK